MTALNVHSRYFLAPHCNTLQHTATHCNTLQDIQRTLVVFVRTTRSFATPPSSALSVFVCVCVVCVFVGVCGRWGRREQTASCPAPPLLSLSLSGLTEREKQDESERNRIKAIKARETGFKRERGREKEKAKAKGRAREIPRAYTSNGECAQYRAVEWAHYRAAQYRAGLLRTSGRNTERVCFTHTVWNRENVCNRAHVCAHDTHGHTQSSIARHTRTHAGKTRGRSRERERERER